MGRDRVKYYSKADLLYPHAINLALDRLKSFDEHRAYFTLEEILELYNIVKYIDDNVQSILKKEEDKPYFDAKMKSKLMKPVGKFFNGLDNTNIKQLEMDSIHGYGEDFLELFEKHKAFNRIGDNEFFETLEILRIPDYYIYQQKKLVNHYDKHLIARLLNSEQAFDLLLKKYISTDIKKELFLPPSLTKEDKENITINYIKSKFAHINVLEIIISLPVFDDFSISDDTRVLAKDRYDELVKELFVEKKGVGLQTELVVGFSDELKDEFKLEYTVNKLSLLISKKWISDNLDYPTLLNNLIYIIGLTDIQMRVCHISKPNSMHALTRSIIDRKLKNFYLFGQEFTLINKFTQIAVATYRDYLQAVHNIRLEEVVQWFFDSYLHEEFSLTDFSVNMPSKDSTYLEKCRTICCEFESLLKQYDSLVKYGKVRHDVIEISSRPVSIETVRSLVELKYVYPNMDKCYPAMYWLFSDQTLLTYFESNKERQKYENFVKLLHHEKVKLDEYEEHQKIDLKYLFNEKIIDTDDEGYIYFIEPEKVNILYDLYMNEFGVYDKYIKSGCEKIIKELLEKEWITVGSSLFAKQESSYINFYLNKQKYFNGDDLRNTYLHGTQRKHGQDAELHKLNYNTLLVLYLIAVIKINDDLCQNADINN